MARQRVERRREGAGVRPVSCRTIRTSTVSTISRLPRPFVDSVRIFFLACILIYPLLKLEYLDNWGSIESTFISDARMLREHLPHPAWQPLWYCGRSEEHTSELQSHLNLVCRLLLEKKKNQNKRSKV